jgi:hypothetical protein
MRPVGFEGNLEAECVIGRLYCPKPQYNKQLYCLRKK